MGTSTKNRGRLPPESASPFEWFRIWIGALTHPSVAYYKQMAAKAPASTLQAYLWIAIALSIDIVFYTLKDDPFGGAPVISSIVMVIFAMPLTLLFVVVQLRIIDWLARRLGGSGKLSTYTFTYAAIAAPMLLAEALFYWFPSIQCFNFPCYLYGFLLNVVAIQVVYKLTLSRAFFSYLVPELIWFVLFTSCSYLIIDTAMNC
jgi:hypothetical protein